jgi:hypothetical protein
MLPADTHFGHRESAGIVVDLFWSHGEPGDRFRVEVQDTRAGDRFVLYPATGPEAIHAFHHPLASALAARTRPHGRALQRHAAA